MRPRLCLGTAQFGLNYGISNTGGKVHAGVARKILARAARYGIHQLDTAQAYGTAEKVVGQFAKAQGDNSYSICSKLPKQNKAIFTKEDKLLWSRQFDESCRRLNTSIVDTLLLHDTSDIRKEGREYLLEWLIELKESGRVSKLGVSVYGKEDLEDCPDEVKEVVQLPISLYDQRVINSGLLKDLKDGGSLIYGRSIYLQGLILLKSRLWPSWICSDVKKHHERLESYVESRGCSLIEAALAFARRQHYLDTVIVGICSVRELDELLDCWNSPFEWEESESASWSLQEGSILDPRCWPKDQ